MKMTTRTPWKDIETWQQYGLEQGYNERNSVSLSDSDIEEERSWYGRGQRKEWLGKFNFKRLVVEKWPTFEEWESYGLEKGHNKRNSTSFLKSENEKERSWFNRGSRKKWLRDFKFTKVRERWLGFKTWQQYGLEQGYNERSPSSLSESDNDEERKWYKRGSYCKWMGKFSFERKYHTPRWLDFETWKQYGLDHRHDQRSPSSLSESDNDEERKWYKKGTSKGWSKKFDFKRRYKNKAQFLTFLEQDETARGLAAASISLDIHGSNGYDLERILYDIYSDRFSDQTMVHQLIQDGREDILRLTQEGFTNLGAYLGEYSLEDREMTPILLGQALSGLSGHVISYDLEQRLVGILRSAYGPLFNKSPEKILDDLEAKVEDSPNKLREIYRKVYGHYQEVLELAEELRNG